MNDFPEPNTLAHRDKLVEALCLELKTTKESSLPLLWQGDVRCMLEAMEAARASAAPSGRAPEGPAAPSGRAPMDHSTQEKDSGGADLAAKSGRAAERPQYVKVIFGIVSNPM